MKCKQDVMTKFSFIFNAYIKETEYTTEDILMIEKMISHKVDVKWKDRELSLPVGLTAKPDKVVMEDGKIAIVDEKTSDKFPNPDKIDGRKILEACVSYFAVYAETCLLYTSPSPRDRTRSRMPSSA